MSNFAKKSCSRRKLRILQKDEDCAIEAKKAKIGQTTSDQINEMVQESLKKHMSVLKKALLQNIPKSLAEYEKQINNWKETYSNATLIMNQKYKEAQETDLLVQKLKQEISENKVIIQNFKHELKEKNAVSEKLFQENKQLKQDLEREKSKASLTLSALKATLNKPPTVNNLVAQSTKSTKLLNTSQTNDNNNIRPNYSNNKIQNKTIAVIRSNKSPNGLKPPSLPNSINDAVIDLTDDSSAPPQHNNVCNKINIQPTLPLVSPPDQPVKLRLTTFLSHKNLRLFWTYEKMTQDFACIKSYELWTLGSKERCWRQLLEVQTPALPASCDVSHHSTASYCILPVYHSLHKGPFSNIVVVKSTQHSYTEDSLNLEV